MATVMLCLATGQIWRMEKVQIAKRSPSIQTGGLEDADDDMSPTSTVADYAQPTASEDEHRQCRRSPAAKADVDEDFSVLTTGSNLHASLDGLGWALIGLTGLGWA